MDLFVDSRDRVWLATTRDLFIKEDSTFKRYGTDHPIPFGRYADKAPRLFLEDQSGGIWIAHANGLSYLAPDDDNFSHLPDNHPLRDISITDMIEDREGNIWLSSLSGLYRFSKGKFSIYSMEEGLGSRNIRGVSTFKDGGYIVGTDEHRLYEIKDGAVLPIRIQDPEIQANLVNIFMILTDSKQNIWVGASIGSVRISINGEKRFNEQIRYVFEDYENMIWFGVPFKGISFLNDNDELEFLKFPNVDFTVVFISSIRKLANQNWLVTTFDDGILLIDPDGNLVINEATEELKNATVFTSYEDEDGVVWLTTSSGLYRYKNEILTRTGYESGMPEISVFNFLPDKLGYVWFPTNKGVIRAKKQEINDYLDNKTEQINWRLFDQGDGMRSRASVGSRHSAISPEGKILIPTFDGLLEIDPANLSSNPVPPPVVIHGFGWNGESLNLTDPQKLPPGNHRLVFEYSALSLTAPEKVAFKFRLIGYDEDWIIPSGDRRAIYTNLPFGEYTFQVIASNNDGIWNEEGAKLSFTITPPWWRTWWAYGLYALLLAIILYSANHFQHQRLVRKERERAKEKELEQAREIEKAYRNLEVAHTNLKSAQDQLVQQEKLASLGQLTAGIAHEIKNPLNFVNNFSEVSMEMIEEIKEERAKSQETRDETLVDEILEDIQSNLGKIHEHGSRANGIVTSMLQHSRGGSGKKEPTDLNALIKEYVNLSFHGMRAGKNPIEVDIQLDLDDSIGKINLIGEDFSRVILNLCNNAFDALKSLKTQHLASLKVRTKKLDGNITIEIEDNGPGIPDDIKDKILQPFFTTKKGTEGTGLGLSITHDILKAHGGELQVYSRVGEGTSFLISLSKNTVI
ncbi:ATP-binding protein [Algoriphagus sp.]|uniref:sensor histidine kinase n=1 Tax=Algoriphagus sp. TaxID=1872435 RepID=UPI00391AE63A